MASKGAVAAGHPLTARTAKEVLAVGGNAFDAAVAAHFTACVAEPVLASLGGGGFMLAQTAMRKSRLYDFFVQTPRRKLKAQDIDFKPIVADFGATQQEFHIGLGSVATPGTVKGLFEIHRQLGRMPMRELVAPAIELARAGVTLNDFQSYIFDIVSPILLATPEPEKIFTGGRNRELLRAGETIYFHQLADTLEALASEGAELFYHGEIAHQLVEQCQAGGHLRLEDLTHYEVSVDKPLEFNFRGHQIYTNPPPSSGGVLIAFALGLWASLKSNPQFGDFEHLALLIEIMSATNQARLDAQLEAGLGMSGGDLFESTLMRRYRQQVLGRAKAMRGTTHISVIDQWQNVATMTVSNGEGCGSIVPGTGIMLNNMLGEEDLNPSGFHCWPENERMTSMMAPSIINRQDGAIVALGSGGSNRIRTALLQVMINMLDFNKDLDCAIRQPRVHYENDFLSVEAGYDSGVINRLFECFKQHKLWEEVNLFFGGVHAAMVTEGQYQAVGDIRRGGVGL